MSRFFFIVCITLKPVITFSTLELTMTTLELTMITLELTRAYHDNTRAYHDNTRAYHDNNRAYHDNTRAYHDNTRAYHDRVTWFTRCRLFQKRVVRTTLDIYVFITRLTATPKIFQEKLASLANTTNLRKRWHIESKN